jgi:hypothetical protein
VSTTAEIASRPGTDPVAALRMTAVTEMAARPAIRPASRPSSHAAAR